MPTIQPVNFYLRPIGGPSSGAKDKPCGKVYWHQDRRGARWAFEFTTRAEWRRRDSHAWGINVALHAWLVAHGIRDVFLRDRATKATYHTTTDELARAGLAQEIVPGFGRSLNLPVEQWSVVPHHRSQWVPAEAKRVIPVEDAAGAAA